MLKHRKLRAVKRKQHGLELEVCWRDDRFGKGPCFSVYRHHREVLRFDLFERGAHYHSYREPNQPRHYFTRSGETVKTDNIGAVNLDRMEPPPFDVLIRKAVEIARKHYPAVDAELERWIAAELWTRKSG
jgi:hypothetical protein